MQDRNLVTFFAIHRMMIKSGGFLDGTGGILLATRKFLDGSGGILLSTRLHFACYAVGCFFFFLLLLTISSIKFFGGS